MRVFLLLNNITFATALLISINVQVVIYKVNNSFQQSLGGLKFGKDGDGNYGYYGADGSLIPFSTNRRYSYSWTSSNDEIKTLTLEIEPKYISFTASDNRLNATLYDVENKEYIINTGANTIASVNGKVVTINTYHLGAGVNYLNYW